MSEILKKFGRYFLLDQIAQGGTAEIYRARMANVDSGGRVIVIKRIQAGLGTNPNFLKMFQTEIRITQRFSHPNIVQLHDFGEETSLPFLAMELVEGKNLREILTTYSAQEKSFPPDFAAYIIQQCAEALHYAHSYVDPLSGLPMSIVHRDVSPQNILVSYDGTVKLIDFGIAKATHGADPTHSGVIQGKPAYLSPEQISGEVLDGRSDLFSLGIVFWELLTGQKLFLGDTELGLIKKIDNCDHTVKPPSLFNAGISPELDDIVLKLLRKNPDERFESGDGLQRMLHRFLNTSFGEFTPADLALGMQAIFQKEMLADREKLHRLNAQAELILQDKPSIRHFRSPAEDPDTTTFIGSKYQKPREAVLSFDEAEIKKVVQFHPLEKGQLRLTPQPLPRSQIRKDTGRSWWVPASLSMAALLLGGAIFLRVFSEPPRLETESIPSSPSVVAVSSPTPLPSGTTPVAAVPPPPAALVQNKVLVNFRIIPQGSGTLLSLNGMKRDSANPAWKIPEDATIEIEATRPGFKPYRQQIKMTEQAIKGNQLDLEVTLEPVDYGIISVQVGLSSDAAIYSNGKVYATRTAPFKDMKLPAGVYTLRVSSPHLGLSRVEKFTVYRGRASTITTSLVAQKNSTSARRSPASTSAGSRPSNHRSRN